MAQPPSDVSRRVLLVDDHQDSAESLALLLQLKGYEVAVAGDGQGALETAARFHPHIVLLDIGMPGMDGYETARLLRQQPAGETLLLVALTGWGRDHDLQRSREAGFDHHVVKPIDAEALAAWLEQRKAS
jgi:CheY-like chemotaxis protein